jgi:hypothetical protein
VLKILPPVILLFALAGAAFGQSIEGGGSPVVSPNIFHPVSSTTTLDPSHCGTGIALSGGNLVATEGTPSGSNGDNCRSVASHSSGKFYAEMTITNIFDLTTIAFGIMNASGGLNNSFVGMDTNGIGAFTQRVWTAGSAGAQWASTNLAQGDVICMAADFDNGKIYFRLNGGNWNNSGSANPATNTGGFALSVLAAGPYFATVNMELATQVVTLDFGASAFAFAAPSGFGSW